MSKQSRNNLNEGPEWGAESAAAYKAVTPGQENAEQVPKTEETPTPDQIQKLVDIVAKRIMGLKESIVRYGTDWNTIAHFLDLYEEKGIDYLVEVCHILDKRKGKRLRDVVEAREIEEETNPDEFMSESGDNKYDAHHEIISSALNHFGTGGHPQANRQNLGFFKKKYVKSTLEKARKHVSDEHKGKLEAAIKHVDSLKEEVVDEGMMKSLKRGLKGWGGPSHYKTDGSSDKPRDIVNRVKKSSNDDLKKLSNNKVNDGSPAALQKKAAEHELKKRTAKE